MTPRGTGPFVVERVEAQSVRFPGSARAAAHLGCSGRSAPLSSGGIGVHAAEDTARVVQRRRRLTHESGRGMPLATAICFSLGSGLTSGRRLQTARDGITGTTPLTKPS